jgi:hypothetical protein
MALLAPPLECAPEPLYAAAYPLPSAVQLGPSSLSAVHHRELSARSTGVIEKWFEVLYSPSQSRDTALVKPLLLGYLGSRSNPLDDTHSHAPPLSALTRHEPHGTSC